MEKYRALAFFLEWPRFDLGAKLVLYRSAEWEGRHYGYCLAAEAFESAHPAAATILYRRISRQPDEKTRRKSGFWSLAKVHAC